MKAAIYLRVSTLEQVGKGNTNRDGYSIPAQREACRKKAEILNIKRVKEYVDKGESARTADRPALQQLLQDLRTKKEFTHVIVHKLDRLARDLYDDVMISFVIKKCGAQLVSVTENIDDTPAGRLLHAIMAGMSEFYSSNLAMESLKGSTEKAKQGGTPFYAPIGYMNIIENSGGRENRTIIPDPQRAELIRWGFERYATGDDSIKEIHRELTERGLKGRRKSINKPINKSTVSKILGNRYYLGYVSYNGSEYKGTHQPLVTPAVFNAVQAVLACHRLNGEANNKHYHFLSRLLRCGRCHRQLCLTISKHRYPYFFCMNRSSGCDLPYIPVMNLEEVLFKLLNKSFLDGIDRTQLLTDVSSEFENEVNFAEQDFKVQNLRIARLESQQESLLQSYYNKLIEPELLKKEQKRILKELKEANKIIVEANKRVEIISERKSRALAMIEDWNIIEIFQKASPTLKNCLCKSFFSTLYVDDIITDNRRGFGKWREHNVRIKRVAWNKPINVHKIGEVVLTLAIEREEISVATQLNR